MEYNTREILQEIDNLECAEPESVPYMTAKALWVIALQLRKIFEKLDRSV
jgi:hypothetical protein